jgi:AAA domain-containing protein
MPTTPTQLEEVSRASLHPNERDCSDPDSIHAYKSDPLHESNFHPIAAPELLAEPPEEVDWVVEEILPAGGLVLLVGKPKEGKTTLSYELAVNVAQGLTFLGRKTRKETVLILALEEHSRDVGMRLRNIGATYARKPLCPCWPLNSHTHGPRRHLAIREKELRQAHPRRHSLCLLAD